MKLVCILFFMSYLEGVIEIDNYVIIINLISILRNNKVIKKIFQKFKHLNF